MCPDSQTGHSGGHPGIVRKPLKSKHCNLFGTALLGQSAGQTYGPGFLSGSHPMAAPAPKPASRGGSDNQQWLHTPAYPTCSRAPAPTAAPPGARLWRPGNISTQSTGSRAPAPTAAPSGARPQRREQSSTRSTGSRSPALTAVPPNARPVRPSYTSAQSTGSRSPWPTPAARWMCKTPRSCA